MDHNQFPETKIRCLKNYVARFETEKEKKTPKTFRTDCGGGYTGRERTEWLQTKGIKHEFSVPYTPQQSGVSKRYNRTVVEMARCLPFGKNLLLSLWAVALNHSNFIRTEYRPKIVHYHLTQPYTITFGKPPDMSQLKTFGSTVYIHIPDARRRKLDVKCDQEILVGVSESTKGWRVWCPSEECVKVSRDILFDESAAVSAKESDNGEVFIDSEVFVRCMLPYTKFT